MNNKENRNSKVIFGYMIVPTCGWIGKDHGGFSIAVYPDGKLIYKTYIFDQIEKTKKEFELGSKIVERIVKVLALYELDIEKFDEYLNNGSCDGNGNYFIFNGKEISDRNIEYHDENKLKDSNPQYYKEYLPVIQQENLMVEIFSKIAKILKRQGISLTLNMVRFRRKKHWLRRKGKII